MVARRSSTTRSSAAQSEGHRCWCSSLQRQQQTRSSIVVCSLYFKHFQAGSKASEADRTAAEAAAGAASTVASGI